MQAKVLNSILKSNQPYHNLKYQSPPNSTQLRNLIQGIRL
jgi:hypothetical protein